MIDIKNIFKRYSEYIIPFSDPLIKDIIDYYFYESFINCKLIQIARNTYCQYHPTTDIFDTLTDYTLDLLRTDDSLLIYFDTEATSQYFPIYECLHHNCKIYNINPSRILYIGANIFENELYEDFVQLNHIEDKINVLAYPMYDLVSLCTYHRLRFNDIVNLKNNEELLFNKSIKKFRHEYQDKFFSSLSRRNRFDRTMGLYCMSSYLSIDRCLISHAQLSTEELEGYLNCLIENKCKYLIDDFVKWTTTLPLSVDNISDNKILYSFTPLVHYQSLFHIASESVQNDLYKKSMYFTEKTCKPILNFQPFIVLGQEGCHKILEDRGFKLFYDLFDYSFDQETNLKNRYDMLFNMLKDVSIRLEKLTRDEQIQLRVNQAHILKHNFIQLHNLENFKHTLFEVFKFRR